MKITRDPIHDSLVATYQSLEADILNRALLENGIHDETKRRSIMESFLFQQGVMLDQYWFKENGQQWYPGVFFSTKPHCEIGSATVHLPSEEYGMNLHEYVHGAADWAIDNEANTRAIEVGNV
jgi:hypothetical protein